MRRDPFQAIADPTRRAILELVAAEPLTMNAVAAHFDISRPAISKHMKVLMECGLVIVEAEGRERHCRADLRGLQEVEEWMAPYRRFWNRKLDDLDRFLESPGAKSSKRKKK